MRSLLLFFLLVTYLATAQNYVTNGSFERESPRKAGVWKVEVLPCQFSKASPLFTTNAQGWNTFDLMTPDLLVLDTVHSCPHLPAPPTGRRMVGLIMYHPFQDGQFSFDYHELIQGSLGKPLEKGRTYRVSFWTRSDDSLGLRHLSEVYGRVTKIRPVYCGNFGFYFSIGPITTRENFMESQLDFSVQPQLNLEDIVATNGEWRQYSFTFRADQPYRYFLFGNFFSDAVTKINMNADERERLDVQNTQLGPDFWQKTKRIAYYLFDDFRVAVDTGTATLTLEKALREHNRYTFPEGVLFDFGKSILRASAQTELVNLTQFLQKNPAIHVEIGGHTDNIGGTAANQRLSEQRAQAVYDYLVQHQVATAQISWRGYGEAIPVAPNDTETNRQRNRRVEITGNKQSSIGKNKE